MKRLVKWQIGVALLGLAGATQAQERVLEGSLADGLGRYRIELPAGWQPGGRLIVYNHGFNFNDPNRRAPSTSPSAEVGEALRAQGYALAAGSYASRGWALFDIVPAQRALLDTFRSRAGEPGQTILFGGSLGGLVSVLTAEALAAEGRPVDGVLAACPPLGGARTWDQAVDVRLVYDAVCSGHKLPASSDPALPWILDADDIPEDIDNIDDPDSLADLASAANRIRQCTGLIQPAILDTSAQRARKARLKSLLGLSSDDFLKTQLLYALAPLSDLVRDPTKLGGRSAFDNRNVIYGDAEVDATVRRVERDPIAAVRLSAVSDPRGGWGDARVLLLHTTRDELVFPEHIAALPIRAGDRPPVTAFVRESSPGHCDFEQAELGAALVALQAWMDGGPAPSAAGLDAACEAGADAARCRFAPEYQVAPLDSRIRSRRLNLLFTDQDHTGAWFDPSFNGEGWVVEVLENGVDAAVTWYTYPDSGEPGEQRWIAGIGRIAQDGIHIAEAFETRGPAFGGFDPDDVEYQPWGEFTLAFDGTVPGSNLGSGRLAYRGRGGETGERVLQQVATHARPPQHHNDLSPQPRPPHPESRYSGSWFRGAEAAGEGLQFLVDAEGRGTLVWYTYDPAGHAAWLLGPTSAAAEPGVWRFQALRPRGTRFGEDFVAGEVQTPTWGEIELRFSGCESAQLRWSPSEPGWSAGEASLVRLTRPAGSAPCETSAEAE
ncbi:hypothetical protein [Pseudomarimonas salicorniae]|uniref:Alpha/beta hydrolase family protein n=1 Tax=Pseudomarimonas salicorniae TaxID=2933270 RepID=A0ABT0GCP5_9GAMM|nr:hypothetical protein [Lysobacter sp. CAU 1642]MCK7592308.1 hypothetical protein [Lysobacter sp. CAU 1642]